MTKRIRGILMTFLVSRPARRLLIEILVELSRDTKNTLDDAAVELVRSAILPEEG